jgi:hypothetical protein
MSEVMVQGAGVGRRGDGADGRLRSVLRANAAVSAASGIVCVVAAGPLARVLDVGTAEVWTVGLGIAGFALLVAGATRASGSRLADAGAVIGLADAAWVAGSAALVAAGTFPAGGDALVVGAGAVVATLAVLELRGAAALRRP